MRAASLLASRAVPANHEASGSGLPGSPRRGPLTQQPGHVAGHGVRRPACCRRAAASLTADRTPALARAARRRSAASRTATVAPMPGGRRPGSWSRTWDRPCHGYSAPSAAAHSAQIRCRAAWELLVCLPERAAAQVLGGVGERAPAEEGPLADLIGGDRVGPWMPVTTRARTRTRGPGLGGPRRPGGCAAREQGHQSGAAAPRRTSGSAMIARSSWVPSPNCAKTRRMNRSGRPGPVPQHVDHRAEPGQRPDQLALDGQDLPRPAGTGLAAKPKRRVDVRQRVGRAPAQRAPDRQRGHQRRGHAPAEQRGQDPPLRGQFPGQASEPGVPGSPASAGVHSAVIHSHPLPCGPSPEACFLATPDPGAQPTFGATWAG